MRRRRIQKKRGKEGLSIGTIILLLLLVAAFVYVFQALGIYDMLLNPGASPGFTTAQATLPAVVETASPDKTDAQASESPSTATGGKVTTDIKMGAVTLYGVQLGVFTKEENAKAAAEELKKKGAAGYILKEDAMYRVLDSVHYNQNDAKAVRDAYKNNGTADAYLLNVQASGINWKVSASTEQIETIRSSITVLQKEVVGLIDVQKRAGQQSNLLDSKAAVKKSAENLSAAHAALTKAVGNTNSGIINKLSACLDDSSKSLTQLSQDASGDAVAFNAGLKYNIIEILLKLQKEIMEAQ